MGGGGGDGEERDAQDLDEEVESAGRRQRRQLLSLQEEQSIAWSGREQVTRFIQQLVRGVSQTRQKKACGADVVRRWWWWWW